jgi:chromosome segregation ATPase
MKDRQLSALSTRPAPKRNGPTTPGFADHSSDSVTAAHFKELSARMSRMEHELDQIKRAWEMMGTSRQGVHDQIERDRADLDVQFRRIADMQAEVDRLKAAEAALQSEVKRLRSTPSSRLA